jgi:hypothetical protein
MKHIIVDPFLFEVSHAVDRDVTAKFESAKSCDRGMRLVAALTALETVGFAKSTSSQQDHWMTPSKVAIAAMQLGEFGLSRRKTQNFLLRPKFRFALELQETELSYAADLSSHYAANLSEVFVNQSWRSIGTIVGHTAVGDFRLIGPEANYGLILEAVTPLLREQIGGERLWFSLGELPAGHPDPIDLQQDIDGVASVDGIIIRWPIVWTKKLPEIEAQ